MASAAVRHRRRIPVTISARQKHRPPLFSFLRSESLKITPQCPRNPQPVLIAATACQHRRRSGHRLYTPRPPSEGYRPPSFVHQIPISRGSPELHEMAWDHLSLSPSSSPSGAALVAILVSQSHQPSRLLPLFPFSGRIHQRWQPTAQKHPRGRRASRLRSTHSYVGSSPVRDILTSSSSATF
ncbi:hypothetical protein GQ457_10G016060 [Hibiscus cannabinus]